MSAQLSPTGKWVVTRRHYRFLIGMGKRDFELFIFLERHFKFSHHHGICYGYTDYWFIMEITDNQAASGLILGSNKEDIIIIIMSFC